MAVCPTLFLPGLIEEHLHLSWHIGPLAEVEEGELDHVMSLSPVVTLHVCHLHTVPPVLVKLDPPPDHLANSVSACRGG